MSLGGDDGGGKAARRAWEAVRGEVGPRVGGGARLAGWAEPRALQTPGGGAFPFRHAATSGLVHALRLSDGSEVGVLEDTARRAYYVTRVEAAAAASGPVIQQETARRLASVAGRAPARLDAGELDELAGVLDGEDALDADVASAPAAAGGEAHVAALLALLRRQGPLLQRAKELCARAGVLAGEAATAPLPGAYVHVLAAEVPDTSAFVQVLEQFEELAGPRLAGLAGLAAPPLLESAARGGAEMLGVGVAAPRRQPRVWAWVDGAAAATPAAASALARAFVEAADGVAAAHLRRDLRLSYVVRPAASRDGVEALLALARPRGAVPAVSCPPRDLLAALERAVEGDEGGPAGSATVWRARA